MSARRVVENSVKYFIFLTRLLRLCGDPKELLLFEALERSDATSVLRVLKYVVRVLAKDLGVVGILVGYRGYSSSIYRRLAIETHKRLRQLGVEHPRRGFVKVYGVRKASYTLAVIAEGPYIIDHLRSSSPPYVRDRALRYVKALTYLGLPLWAANPSLHNLELVTLRIVLRYLATIAAGQPPEDIQ